MSFLKKHWRFTVLAVFVLCVLLLGVVVLYRTGGTPEPKTVYVMPERSEAPPSLNTDEGEGLIRSVPTIETDTSNNAVSIENPSDVETVESCCPDESADASQFFVDDSDTEQSSSNMVRPSPEMIADAHSHSIYWEALDRYTAKDEELTIQRKQLRMEMRAAIDELMPPDATVDERVALHAALTTEQKAEIYAKLIGLQARDAALTEKENALIKEYPTSPHNTHSD